MNLEKEEISKSNKSTIEQSILPCKHIKRGASCASGTLSMRLYPFKNILLRLQNRLHANKVRGSDLWGKSPRIEWFLVEILLLIVLKY